jgi:5-methylcytosine-specific restriction protein A
VDHMIPLSKEGTDKPSNLQSLCSECHERKSKADRGLCEPTSFGVDGWPAQH